jgi:hypothetical protein
MLDRTNILINTIEIIIVYQIKDYILKDRKIKLIYDTVLNIENYNFYTTRTRNAICEKG